MFLAQIIEPPFLEFSNIFNTEQDAKDAIQNYLINDKCILEDLNLYDINIYKIDPNYIKTYKFAIELEEI